MKKKLLLILLIVPICVLAQKKEETDIFEDFYIIKNDSLTIPLDEIVVFDKRSFDSDKEKRYYFWYYKKVHKAYPFAAMAAEKLSEINAELDVIKSKRKRKKHIKKIQNYMEEEFAPQLKKLTRTEGRILIKLVNRQTGETMYELIKEYRSGWKAFWYNSSANLFKLSLKNEYKPEENAMDFIIEDILQRSFINGTLEKQEPKMQIDYLQLLNEWDDLDVLSEISAYIDKYMK